MKRLLIATALLAFAGAASAQSTGMVEEEEEASRSRAAPKAEPDDRVCIQQTGSRITAARNARSRDAEKDCVASGGRVYTRRDIENSGETDLADALRKLDPSIR